MGRWFGSGALAAVALLAAAPDVALADPVVVELYTSQGCSSCPPADALLTELAGDEGVIPLALHVDYWDYIGWKDPFGRAAHTERQKAYARAANARTIYTPQMVIGGVDHVVGARPMQVMGLIQKHAGQPPRAELALSREAGTLRIRAEALGALPDAMAVTVIRYRPHAVTEIETGENAGHTLGYSNIVTDLEVVGRWRGDEPLELNVPAGEGPVAVIVQADGPGQVIAAARLR